MYMFIKHCLTYQRPHVQVEPWPASVLHGRADVYRRCPNVIWTVDGNCFDSALVILRSTVRRIVELPFRAIVFGFSTSQINCGMWYGYCGKIPLLIEYDFNFRVSVSLFTPDVQTHCCGAFGLCMDWTVNTPYPDNTCSKPKGHYLCIEAWIHQNHLFFTIFTNLCDMYHVGAWSNIFGVAFTEYTTKRRKGFSNSWL